MYVEIDLSHVFSENISSHFSILVLPLLFIRTDTCSRTHLKGKIYGPLAPVGIRFALIEQISLSN